MYHVPPSLYLFQTAAPVSRYSYVSRAPRSTIWDYNFSNSTAGGGESQTQSENKPTKFSFVPRTENKPEPSTAEKVRLGSGSGSSRQSRPRTRSTAVTNFTEEENKQKLPLKLPSWQLNRPTVSLSYNFYDGDQRHFPTSRNLSPDDPSLPQELLPKPVQKSCPHCPARHLSSPVSRRNPELPVWGGM